MLLAFLSGADFSNNKMNYIFGRNNFLELWQREFIFVLGQVFSEYIFEMFEVFWR